MTSLEVINRVRPHSIEPYLKDLEQAIAHGYSVKIQYYKSSEAQSQYRMFNPYRIIYWNNKWYVIGFCHLRNDIRSFRVDRIESLVLTENKFNQPEDFTARDVFLKNLLPTEDNEGTISLVISGNKSALNDVCQHWFLGSYLQERTSNQAVFLLEKSILHTYVPPPPPPPNLLLPYGKSIQVIEPISFKKRLIEVLTELIHFHEV